MEYQWHVFLANLDPVVGSEQGRTRHVLVISNEKINQILPVVNVLPMPMVLLKEIVIGLRLLNKEMSATP